jgi:Phage terminase, small subunit
MATDTPELRPLTAREDRFCELYVALRNGKAAAEGASYSPRRAKQAASELLKRSPVIARIEQLRAELAAETKIEAADEVREFCAIGTADPSELVEYRRTCCRHCYGLHHNYQRTQRELDKDRGSHEALQEELRTRAKIGHRKAPDPKPFDEQGGAGWDPRRPPNEQCPECFGEGVERAHFKDTRLLSPQARRLYAGVKISQNGIELKMHNPIDALVNVGKSPGMFKEVVEHRDFSIEDLIRAAAGEEEAHAGDA